MTDKKTNKQKKAPWLVEARKKAAITLRQQGAASTERYQPTFKYYRDHGWTFQQIADHMNNLGIKTIRGNKWTVPSVRYFTHKKKNTQG